MRRKTFRNMGWIVAILLLFAIGAGAQTQPSQSAPVAHPRVLIVVAHPDDESCFSVTVYEITHNLGGTVDQLVITNGEGGYRYSLLAESYYHAPLTEEAVGRAMLPEIRKQEVMNSGRILGIANEFFLDERDVRFTLDVDEVLNQHWRPGVVLDEVTRRLEDGKYDFVLTLFPNAGTHGGHKAAAITAMNAVEELPADKPVVLGCLDSSSKDAAAPDWAGFKSDTHPFTVGAERYSVDRAVKFGPEDALSYQIIANWVIAEHKSQGAFQMDMNRFDKENFAILETETASAGAKAEGLFQRLSETAANPITPSQPGPVLMPAAH
ncbi:MAG: PIG-L family deacetylase [Candidatus Acidiferrales bacterium]